MKGILAGEPVSDLDGFSQLRSAGILAGDFAADARFQMRSLRGLPEEATPVTDQDFEALFRHRRRGPARVIGLCQAASGRRPFLPRCCKASSVTS